MVKNFKQQLDRLTNKGGSGSSSTARHRKLCVLPRIKFSLLAKCKGKSFHSIFPFLTLHSKETFNKSLRPHVKPLCQTHASMCLGADSRKCNVKRDINTPRSNRFLERHKKLRQQLPPPISPISTNPGKSPLRNIECRWHGESVT